MPIRIDLERYFQQIRFSWFPFNALQ
jgi:hypothetical protein